MRNQGSENAYALVSALTQERQAVTAELHLRGFQYNLATAPHTRPQTRQRQPCSLVKQSPRAARGPPKKKHERGSRSWILGAQGQST